MDFPVLYLRKGAERRLRAGHLWVYSNEVDTQRSPLPGFEPGSQVQPVVVIAPHQTYINFSNCN